MVVAIIALVVAATGTAFAALKINSVGSRQIKSSAVTSNKFAAGSVTSAKVAKETLTGADVNVGALGKLPSAAASQNAAVANSLGEHAAACPAGAVLIRGLCFDSTSKGPVTGVKTAADDCAQAGGYLPTTEKLFSTRGVLNLGNGTGVHSQFTDSYFVNPTTVEDAATIVVNNTGQEVVKLENSKKETVATYEYICVYPLIR